MALYLATRADSAVWIVYQSDQDVWSVFVPNTGKFHANNGVYVDHQSDQKLTYLPIEQDEALALARAGVVGWIDPAAQSEILDLVTSGTDSIEAEELLGGPVGIRSPAEREQNRVLMLTTHPSYWLTWQRFSVGDEAAADELADEISHGRVPALAGVGPLDVNVSTGNLNAAVRVRRPGSEQN